MTKPKPEQAARTGSANYSEGPKPAVARDVPAFIPAPRLSGNGAANEAVVVRQEQIVLPTWLPAAPDKHPMFLERRVYQGSSGRVYPLPFTDRIADKPVDRPWQAVWIENEFLRVLVLPEIGGRIHAIQDRTNGYDLIYHQHVIKPALVGLAGPWISGGIEFNWPQHHRPATFLPVDYTVEEEPDGSKTVWCSDHDPMARMKGMHGICLHPGQAVVELKVRAYNRTPFVQTFLWWANVATRVHEGYQSFFPPDVYCVADHARRSMSEYPLAKGIYYGVNYGERGRKGVPENERPAQFVPPHCRGKRGSVPAHTELPDYAPNDLSFYANIPTPCSYMGIGSNEDFFGGYDYFAQAGIIHIANHHISPGKKQWTWGNHQFGYAWDRNLTEKDAKGEYGPYIEIMAGVYTDNQPDFSFLQPGETKTWSQYWYPIQKIGPAQQANRDAAVSLMLSGSNKRGVKARVGVSVTRRFKNAKVVLSHQGKPLLNRRCDLAPGRPLLEEVALPSPGVPFGVHPLGCFGAPDTLKGGLQTALRVTDADGREIIAYSPKPRAQGPVPPPATEPPPPADIASAEELYLTGLHLEQYRHATRSPVPYWQEALRRDPLDARCNNALGLWRLRRGEFTQAQAHFEKAIERLTRRNANPYDGEPFYNLGLCLRYQADQSAPPSPALLDAAYAAFYKATWNQAWQSAAYHALAELDCRRGAWATALEHLDGSLRLNTDNTRARDLKALVLRKLGRAEEAEALLRETLALDPLDWWARHISGHPLEADLQVCLDLAHDYARAGFYADAIALLENAAARKRDLPDQSWGAAPLIHYTLGWLHEVAQERGRPDDLRSTTYDLRGERPSRGSARKSYIVNRKYRQASLSHPTTASRPGWRRSRFSEPPCAPTHATPAPPTTWATCSTTAAGTRTPFASGNSAPGPPRHSLWSGATWASVTSTSAANQRRPKQPMKRPFAPIPPPPVCCLSATSSGSGWPPPRPNACASWKSTRTWCASATTSPWNCAPCTTRPASLRRPCSLSAPADSSPGKAGKAPPSASTCGPISPWAGKPLRADRPKPPAAISPPPSKRRRTSARPSTCSPTKATSITGWAWP